VDEPVERVSIDALEEYVGVSRLLALRKGRMEQMVNHARAGCANCPRRGLIGFGRVLTETRGTGSHHVRPLTVAASCGRGRRASWPTGATDPTLPAPAGAARAAGPGWRSTREWSWARTRAEDLDVNATKEADEHPLVDRQAVR
jgi:hypothetical protein